MIRDTTCHEIVQFDAAPAVVAEACISAIESLGKITNISRETGTIAGELTRRPNPMGYPVIINIRISKKGNQTEVSINTSRREGFVTSGGAQKGLAVFLEELGHNPSIRSKTTAGW